MKTEHNGAKNGGGHWGTREEAKTMSNIARRGEDRRANLRHIIRTSDRVRLVPTFGSQATLPRALALTIRDDDNRLLDDLRASGDADGYRTAYIEEVRRGR